MDKNEMLRVGDAAHKLGVSVSFLRTRGEQLGLTIKTTIGGHRLYLSSEIEECRKKLLYLYECRYLKHRMIARALGNEE